MPDGDGMYVSKLDPGSEAEKAGVQPNDHLVMLNDEDVRAEPYQETLARVRSFASCKMTFAPAATFG